MWDTNLEAIKKKATSDADEAVSGWVNIFARNSGGLIHDNGSREKNLTAELTAFLKAFANPYHIHNWRLRMERRKAFMQESIYIEDKRLNPFTYALEYAPKPIIPLMLDLFCDDYTYVCEPEAIIKIRTDNNLKQDVFSKLANSFYLQGEKISQPYNTERLARIIKKYPQIIYTPINSLRDKKSLGAYLLSQKKVDPFVFFAPLLKENRIKPGEFLEFVLENNPDYTAKAVEHTANHYRRSDKIAEHIHSLVMAASVYPERTADIVVTFMCFSNYPDKERLPEQVLENAFRVKDGENSIVTASAAYLRVIPSERRAFIIGNMTKAVEAGEGSEQERLLRAQILENYQKING